MGTCSDDAVTLSSDDSFRINFDGFEFQSTDEDFTKRIAFRGPQHKGDTDFDKQSLFRNDMYMKEVHVDFLLNWCEPKFPPKLKYYVYMLPYSSIMKKKCKLTFGAEFTKKYKNRLDEPIDVYVWQIKSKKPKMVRMKMRAGLNAILTTGWEKVGRSFNLKKDSIVLFCFDKKDNGEVHILIQQFPSVDRL